MKKKLDLRTICMLGLLTAVCFAGNYARIKLPMTIGGTSAFTLGNITCVLSGLLMGPIGGLASGLGAALYDCMDPAYLMEAPLTFLNKGAMGLVAGVAAYHGRHLCAGPHGTQPCSQLPPVSDCRYPGRADLLCVLFQQVLLLQRLADSGADSESGAAHPSRHAAHFPV